MDRELIIRLAREAGFADGVVEIVGLEGFSRFAALVAAHEREAVLQTTEELRGAEASRNAMFSDGYDYALGHIEEFIGGRK